MMVRYTIIREILFEWKMYLILVCHHNDLSKCFDVTRLCLCQRIEVALSMHFSVEEDEEGNGPEKEAEYQTRHQRVQNTRRISSEGQ